MTNGNCHAADAPNTPMNDVPAHVAIIMDGNGRWAQSRGMPRNEGHRAGTENLRRIIEGAAEYGVKHLTVYAFSTENWTRPEGEVAYLLSLLAEVVDNELEGLNRNGARLRHIGRLDQLPPELQEAVRGAIDLTKNNRRITVNLAWNYGGRLEILDAVKSLIASGIDPSHINEEEFERHLYTYGTPDPDLVIRTAGEMRLSNFLIWQSAYAEYYSTPKYWPDFDKDDLYEALQVFSRRERRYGGLVSR